MVLMNHLQDIYDTVSQNPTLSLPTFKENGLKIDYNPNCVIETTDNGLQPLPFANSEVYQSSILNWRRLTCEHGDCKAVYEVSFDVADSKFNFKAGDTIGIVPHNVESEVNFIISHLSLTQADVCYKLSIDSGLKGKLPTHIPQKSTLRHVLTHCVDLRSVIKKLFLLALSRHTKEDEERKVIEYLCSKEGSAAYSTHILNKNICLIDLFTMFKSCKPPIEVLLANLPRLLPRPYSIVNSGLRDASIIKICFSVMNIRENRRGLTTSWLEVNLPKKELSLENRMKNLNITGFKVPIYLRKNLSGFNLPVNDAPLILIGPGTGVAPFIGFLEEIEYSSKRDVFLYFGCRNSKLDFIYEKELTGFLTRGVLKKLRTAFSRDSSGPKYIQDALLDDGKEITTLIKDGANIFVCGDLNVMAVQVKEALVKCISEHDCIPQEEAERTISNMQKEKRYIVDAWS